MNGSELLLLDLLHSAVTGEAVTADMSFFSGAMTLAASHKVAGIAAFAHCDFPAKYLRRLSAERMKAVKNEAVFHFNTLRIAQALNGAGINAIIVKGMLIKRLYPSPELRPMSDVDIVVKEKDMAEIRSICEAIGLKCSLYGEGGEYNFVGNDGYSVEFHSGFMPPASRFRKASELLSNETETDTETGLLCLNHGAEYAYHIIHAAGHFTDGGIGVKHILDLFVMRRSGIIPDKTSDDILESAGLKLFSDRLDMLSRYWFEGDAETDGIGELAQYIFSSGAYGNAVNRGINAVAEGGSAKKAFFKRVFVPYSEISERYRFVKVFPPLLPLGWVVRCVKVLTSRRKELKSWVHNAEVSHDDAVARADFMRRLGL